MDVRRRIRRALLLRRARRIKFEREMIEVDEFLDTIRSDTPIFRRIYADEVGDDG